MPLQAQTMPAIGAGGSTSCWATDPTALSGTSPAIRTSTSRGASPSPTITVSHSVVVSAPIQSSAVTTARTRPVSSPSIRLSLPATGMHGTPGGGVPMATAAPISMPAMCIRRAARLVITPSRSLPGTTGWISAAPVATTISCG